MSGSNVLSAQLRQIRHSKMGLQPPTNRLGHLSSAQPPDSAPSSRNFSLNYDQFDGVFKETIEEEYSISTFSRAPPERSKRFHFVLPEGEGKEEITEISEQLTQRTQPMEYEVDYDMRKTTVDDIIVETKRKRLH